MTSRRASALELINHFIAKFEWFDPPSPYLLRPWAMAVKKASAGKGLMV